MIILKKIHKLLINFQEINMLKEMKDGIIFNEAVRYLSWARGPFFPKGGATSYSLLLLLLRMLSESQPKKICELGSGQTTTLFLQYINSVPDTNLIAIEHDKNWYIPFSEQFQKTKNFRYIYSPLKNCTVFNIETKWYDYNLLQEKNINMLLIDGPLGTKHYSRIGILNYIPEILDKKFIIIIDDSERKGEQQLVRLIIKKLSKNNIEFKIKTISNLVSQTIIVSKNYRRLLYLI